VEALWRLDQLESDGGANRCTRALPRDCRETRNRFACFVLRSRVVVRSRLTRLQDSFPGTRIQEREPCARRPIISGCVARFTWQIARDVEARRRSHSRHAASSLPQPRSSEPSRNASSGLECPTEPNCSGDRHQQTLTSCPDPSAPVEVP